MRKDPARSSKKNVKGKKATKVCTEKNCPKAKKSKAKKSECKSSCSKQVESQAQESKTVPIDTVFNTVTLFDRVIGQVKDVFKWGKK